MPQTLNIAEKCKLLDDWDKSSHNTSQREFAKTKNIAPKTLRRIISQADEYRHAMDTNNVTSRKRKRKADKEDIDDALLNWFNVAREFNAIISGVNLRTKAESFALDLGFPDWRCSEGWLGRWKKRHNITYKVSIF